MFEDPAISNSKLRFMRGVICINTLKDSPVGITERALTLIMDLVITFGFSFLINILFDSRILIIAVIFSYFYAIFLPLLWNGYTVGKRIVGIRISHLKGKKLTFDTMIIRGFLGPVLYNITAGILTVVSIYLVVTRENKRSIHALLAQTYITSNPLENE